MTDPLMPAICCKRPSQYTKFYDILIGIDTDPYNYVCLISSFLGICGAVYQIFPNVTPVNTHYSYWNTPQRGRKTVIWLAVGDLLASLGIFVRSIIRLVIPVMVQRLRSDVTYCYLLSFWIQYFYAVSWLWTLIYAIDIYLALKEKPSYPKIYHMVTWILPAIFTFIGLSILYYPNSNCFCEANNSFWKFFPNYVVSFLPMISVMIVNPILFTLSSSTLHVIVSQYLSQYTNRERYIVDMIKIKFGLINLTFYACWLPNLVSTIILYASWNDLPRQLLISLWYIMAIMNPLQALFNCLVYRRPEEIAGSPWSRFGIHNYYDPSEKTPLLARKSGSSNNSEEPEFVL